MTSDYEINISTKVYREVYMLYMAVSGIVHENLQRKTFTDYLFSSKCCTAILRVVLVSCCGLKCQMTKFKGAFRLRIEVWCKETTVSVMSLLS